MKKINLSFLILLIFFFTARCSLSKFSSEMNSSSSADPLRKYAWHLSNTGQSVFATTSGNPGVDLNLSETWSKKIYGNGILIQISDDGLEDTHEDINANFPYLNFSKNYLLASPYTATRSLPSASDDNHGTAIAGLIAAVGWNGIGSIGVAPKSHLIATNFLSSNVTQSNIFYLDQASGDFDISNMSWGSTQNTISTINSAYNSQLKSMVTTKRNNKGALFIKASGNDFKVNCHGSSTIDCIGNANFDYSSVMPYQIVVGAVNALGESASYSSTGSNIWISGFGGEFGSDTPAMLTADRSGCTLGYSSVAEFNLFENGKSSENSNCNYTSTFNGTSAAAPLVTGVVALMLEANPNLTWREVKYILAKTANTSNYSTGIIDHPLSAILPNGYSWDQKWITNAAQFKFHNYFGFGLVNTDAAIKMAQDYKSINIDLGTYTETDWTHFVNGLSIAIPDNSSTGASLAINVTDQITIEAVQLQVTVTHPDISELAIELTSPSGTKSVIINAQNSLTGISNFANETFLTNTFYQESSAGSWTVKIVDSKSGQTGTLNSVKLNFVGGLH